jgi:hypothetical protein
VTLADRIADVLEVQPLPVCVLATTVRKQKAEVIAALNGNPERFVHNGLKARASRWSVREVDAPALAAIDELATRWERDLELDPHTAESFVAWFVEIGYLDRVDGNGRVRVTEGGLEVALPWAALDPAGVA